MEYRSRTCNWKLWGPYLSERAWGTPREDYGPDGEPWSYLPHEKARSTAYRWNEDGLGGVSDRHQYLCLAPALWNGEDPILKERLFGLSGPEGNHGEDVKEYYFYLDSTPTHSYLKMLYKYPQQRFPYEELVEENGRRTLDDFEYELIDTGIFQNDRYFDVLVEYAKAGHDDLLCVYTATNRGDISAEIALLPTLWFRNTWSWGYSSGPMGDVPSKPKIRMMSGEDGLLQFLASHPVLGDYYFYVEGDGEALFTENETSGAGAYGKDAFHRYLIEGDREAVNSDGEGTKACALLRFRVEPGQSVAVRCRLAPSDFEAPFEGFDELCSLRKEEADDFYDSLSNPKLGAEEKSVQRQALAGMLWSKQLYYYDVEQWLKGDDGSLQRDHQRNSDWSHLAGFDIISMPDKWEYPWFASWDLAFHCVPLAMVDVDFAKRQLELLTREWYMHPDGKIPAYEWDFGAVNPPLHAWAVWKVYGLEKQMFGESDRAFLEGAFHKLLLNFTWWVNRKDQEGRNVFQGGFLGLDNVSAFDRSRELSGVRRVDQADGTAWVGAMCLTLLKISLELAEENPVYQNSASKLFEHFLRIAKAANDDREVALWDEDEKFYYDQLYLESGENIPLRVRSLVGLLPLIAVEVLDQSAFEEHPVFARRVDWFLSHRARLANHTKAMRGEDGREHRLLTFLSEDKLRAMLDCMLDEAEFLSDHGIRSLSRAHREKPFAAEIAGRHYSVKYEPAESRSEMFGGNSNWRGPVWFPVNYLLIEALQKLYRYLGDDYKTEFPTGSGHLLSLAEVASQLAFRLNGIFFKDKAGRRPVYGGESTFQGTGWNDLLLFYEYFHGDNGAGLGASHQTGWSGLVAKLLQDHPGSSLEQGEERRSWDKMVRLSRSWRGEDQVGSEDLRQDFVSGMLRGASVHHMKSVQADWPLAADKVFGAIPTPLRLHANFRYTGRGVTIALVDGDFFPHPDLVMPENRIKAFVDAVGETVEVFDFQPDEKPRWPGWDQRRPIQWHGLMTSTSACGNGHLSGGLFRGLAPNAEVVLIRTADQRQQISDHSILNALRWLQAHHQEYEIRVVNLSISGEAVPNLEINPIDEAIDRLVAEGVVVTAASGNDGVRNLVPPASAPAAITVGGIDDKNNFDPADIKLWHSNFGAGDGGVLKPEVVAPSLWIVACILPGSELAEEAERLFEDPESNRARIKELKLVGPNYQQVDGTSFAAPIVASACACIVEACRRIAPHGIKEALRKTAQEVKNADSERQGSGVIRPALALSYALNHAHQHHIHYLHTPKVENGHMTFFYHDHDAGSVEVVGSWGKWRNRLPMTQREPGLWTLEMESLAAGEYSYKFVLNGDEWIDDPANPLKSPDGWGGFNSVLRIAGS